MKQYLILLLALPIIFGGCDDFLSKEPDNRAALDSKEKLAELLASAYPEANYIPFCEAMSDNVEDNPNAAVDQRNQEAYQWADGNATHQDTPEYYWNACYTAIAAANHALEYIESSADPSLYSAQKGEALLARAYSHFMLVSLFAKTYHSNSAELHPGIPYVVTPEKVSFGNYSRGTVKSVYDNIERDLLEGISLVNDDAYKKGEGAEGVAKYHFTKIAAYAFATRFYLFKRDYQKVVEYADVAFPDDGYAAYLRPWTTRYKNYSYDELILNYTKSSESANLLLCETLSEWARSHYGLRYSTGATRLQEIFGNNAVKSRNYGFSAYYSSTGTYWIAKFREHFVRSGTSSDTGYPYTIVPLFTAEEVLFNEAEARVMLDQYNHSVSLLNIYLRARLMDLPADFEVTIDDLSFFYDHGTFAEVAMAAILDYKRVEFLHEGLRWFDILRHDIPVSHSQYKKPPLELPANDLRRVLQIPREAISIGKLEPNPR